MPALQKPSILLIDTEQRLTSEYAALLDKVGVCYVAFETHEIPHILSRHEIHVIIMDSGNHFWKNISTLEQLFSDNPQVLFVVIARTRKLEQVLSAMRAGARDYITEPLTYQKLYACCSRVNRVLHSQYAIKTKLFSGIAHDLGSSFQRIFSICNLLSQTDDIQNNPNAKGLIAALHDQALATTELLDNFTVWTRSLAYLQVFCPVKLNVANAIKEVIDYLQTSIKAKNITLDINVSNSHHVYADQFMLQIILRNLISNAVKFTHPSGKVYLYSSINNNSTRISITDSGIGIPANKVKSLLNSCATQSTPGTKNETGSGLGLLLCRDFLAKHRSTLNIVSEPGKGSSFAFELPFIKAKSHFAVCKSATTPG